MTNLILIYSSVGVPAKPALVSHVSDKDQFIQIVFHWSAGDPQRPAFQICRATWGPQDHCVWWRAHVSERWLIPAHHPAWQDRFHVKSNLSVTGVCVATGGEGLPDISVRDIQRQFPTQHGMSQGDSSHHYARFCLFFQSSSLAHLAILVYAFVSFLLWNSFISVC